MTGAWYAIATLLVLSLQYSSFLLNSDAISMATPRVETTGDTQTTGLVVGLATFPTKEMAREIAESLILSRLAACVQVVPAVESYYEWDGKFENSTEVLMIIKTQRNLTQAVVNAVKKKHTYKVPEVVFTDIVDGNEDYLEWAKATTRQANSQGLPTGKPTGELQ